MKDMASASHVIATDLRRAERSITLATRDTTQFLLSMLDGSVSHSLSPALLQSSLKATVATLAALLEGQQNLAMRAHPALERTGTGLGLTVVDWGEGYPKPAMAPEPAGDEVRETFVSA
jgi:hypothetical protein